MTDLTIDPGNREIGRAGFNLDGLESNGMTPDGCMHFDFLPRLDSYPGCTLRRCPSGADECWAISGPCRAGVDNLLPEAADALRDIVSADMRISAVQALRAGQLILLIELVDVDDCVDDPSVRVRLFRGFAAPRTACWIPARGNAYQIDRASLRPGGQSADDAIVDLPSRIEGGRVVMPVALGSDATVFPLAWPLIMPVGTTRLALPTHHPVIAFDVRGDTLTRGDFGGWVLGEDAFNALLPVVLPRYPADQLRLVVALMVDMPVEGVCFDNTMGPNGALGGVSIGFEFSGVRVQLDSANPVVDAPQPGSCEAAGGRDAGRD